MNVAKSVTPGEPTQVQTATDEATAVNLAHDHLTIEPTLNACCSSATQDICCAPAAKPVCCGDVENSCVCQ